MSERKLKQTRSVSKQRPKEVTHSSHITIIMEPTNLIKIIKQNFAKKNYNTKTPTLILSVKKKLKTIKILLKIYWYYLILYSGTFCVLINLAVVLCYFIYNNLKIHSVSATLFILLYKIIIKQLKAIEKTKKNFKIRKQQQ